MDLTGPLADWNAHCSKKGEPAFAPYIVAVIIRLSVGMSLTAAFADSWQVTGALAAVTAGIAAPKIIQQLAKQGLSHSAVAVPPAPPIEPAPTGALPQQPTASEVAANPGGQTNAL
ncbi:hypothetical protein [Streptomyces virginiae]|uniref:hypothetical protein n=1 Tax=Streptomyces virginiae TaxID=1961 RepID=UPI0030DDE571